MLLQVKILPFEKLQFGFVLISLQFVASNIILGAIGASSLASSIFVAFAMPDSAAAHPKRMVGSYLISIVLGIIFYYIGTYLIILQDIMSISLTYELVGAFAVTMTMLCMILFSLEHPPATGLALGLVLEPWQGWTIVIIVLSIIGIATVKTLVSPWLLPDSPHDDE